MNHFDVCSTERPGQAGAQGPHQTGFFVVPQHREESVPVGTTLPGEHPGGSKLHDTLRGTGRQAWVTFLLLRGLSWTPKSEGPVGSLVYTVREQRAILGYLSSQLAMSLRIPLAQGRFRSGKSYPTAKQGAGGLTKHPWATPLPPFKLCLQRITPLD